MCNQLGIFRINHHTGRAYGLGNSGAIETEHRHMKGHGLDQRHTKALMQAGDGKDFGGAIGGGKALSIKPAGKNNGLGLGTIGDQGIKLAEIRCQPVIAPTNED